jgi:hypothetical protein
MARGSRTSATVEAKFRAKYLELGNASAAARACRIAISTGCDLAKRADEDPDFVKARETLFQEHLPEAQAMMMDALRAVHARLLVKDPSPKELAELAKKYGLKSFSYQNPKPQYFRGMTDAFGKMVSKQRLDAEKNGEINSGPAVVITFPVEQRPNEEEPEAATAAPG